jgi:hypothetical protein
MSYQHDNSLNIVASSRQLRSLVGRLVAEQDTRDRFLANPKVALFEIGIKLGRNKLAALVAVISEIESLDNQGRELMETLAEGADNQIKA